VQKDLVQAYMWVNLAVQKGFDQAKELRDAIEKQMTPEQLAEAQRLVAEYQQKRQPK